MHKELIVVLGGTFDPVHNGHLHAGRSVAEFLDADSVVLMPTASPPHKLSPAADALNRVRMLELATGDESLFEISTLELQRSGPSYTYLTLQQLKQSRRCDLEIAWVVGLDMLAELHLWRRAEDVVREARIVTVARHPMPDDFSALHSSLAEFFGSARADQLIADIIDVETVDVSSTEIRSRCKSGQSLTGMVPPPVADYIKSHGLYTD